LAASDIQLCRGVTEAAIYQPDSFREDRIEVLHALMRAHPLATLVTAGAGGLIANLVPVSFSDGAVLRAHRANGNDQLPALRQGGEVLIIFQGPQAYVTPSWYPSKAEHGRVVPTWNYAVVQVRGISRVIDDPAWLRAQLDELTASQEAVRDKPWQVTDAPPAYIEKALGAITGFEIVVQAIEGKWKVSQNRSDPDRRGVADGLQATSGHAELARLVRLGGALPKN
jgi:transcriptional regulator